MEVVHLHLADGNIVHLADKDSVQLHIRERERDIHAGTERPKEIYRYKYGGEYREKNRARERSNIKRIIYHLSMHQPVTSLLRSQQRHGMSITFNSSLCHNPYGHNMLKDYTCVQRAHHRSH